MHQLAIWGTPSKSQIMMDGSDSSQMILQSFDGSFTKQTTLRKLPHSILIENKWFFLYNFKSWVISAFFI